jgi:sugar-specific transcriptional regulator TrmB
MEKWVPVLEDLGLTKIESKVYITLLKLGASLAGKISKEAQLNRTTTYDALKNLTDKGLVSYIIQANRKWFKATNPEIFFELIKEREEEAKKVIPALAMLYKAPKEEHQVTLYYGGKGIKSVFQNMLREGKPIYVIDSEGMFYEKMPYYAPQFIKEIEKRKIKIKHIVRRGVDVHPSKTTEVRYVLENLSSLSVISIYGNKVAITMWTDPPESVIIKNKASAELLKSYFDILWKNAKSN